MGLSFVEGVAKASSMILVSEIGDKTFFLAALMAMRHPRRWVSAGSLSALWIMTLLSAFLGWAAPTLLPRKWTHVLATLLFFFFGMRSLWDGITMTDEHSRAEEEMREAEAQLDESRKKEHPDQEGSTLQNGCSGEKSMNGHCNSHTNGLSSTVTHRTVDSQSTSNGSPERMTVPARRPKPASALQHRQLISPVFFQAFSLVFFGEWGDKSQIATIGLASEENVWGVALGGCLGHAICNCAAVIGGKHLATMISERMIAIFGGILFLAFAAQSLIHGPPL